MELLFETIPLRISVPGNLGITLPMGSVFENRSEIYLTNGTGNACAGQSNVKLSPILPLNDLELSVVGNLGKTLATGSKRNKISF